jgi:putative restriction endonuclease
MASQPTVVALTDERWFEFLNSQAVGGRLDEVNFWRPMGTGFRALSPGEPFFLRHKHPVNAIVGYGYFAHFTLLPITQAWVTFDWRNGDATFEGFVRRISDYRGEFPAETVLGTKPLGCIVLREVRLLQPGAWLPWGATEDWSRNIVAFKGYDLAAGVGQRLRELLRNGGPPELVGPFELVLDDQRRLIDSSVVARDGQGAFRLRVLDAYGRRCSVTGERSLPVLEAAHIQPYLGPLSNHVQNGLSLRADLHRLFDTGYVTVTPELRFEVSRSLSDDFENGRDYYAFGGHRLIVPGRREDAPSRDALEWHANHVFRG